MYDLEFAYIAMDLRLPWKVKNLFRCLRLLASHEQLCSVELFRCNKAMERSSVDSGSMAFEASLFCLLLYFFPTNYNLRHRAQRPCSKRRLPGIISTNRCVKRVARRLEGKIWKCTTRRERRRTVRRRWRCGRRRSTDAFSYPQHSYLVINYSVATNIN